MDDDERQNFTVVKLVVDRVWPYTNYIDCQARSGSSGTWPARAAAWSSQCSALVSRRATTAASDADSVSIPSTWRPSGLPAAGSNRFAARSAATNTRSPEPAHGVECTRRYAALPWATGSSRTPAASCARVEARCARVRVAEVLRGERRRHARLDQRL